LCADGVWRIYERLIEDWRRYDAMLWQLPFGTMSAVGVILTLAFHYIPSSEHVVRAILFTALAWFTLTMMHLSYKVRHFQIERSACIEAIEHECLMGFTVPYDTRGARDILDAELKEVERGFYEVRSYHLAYVMYIGLIAMLFFLTFIELLPYICLNNICLIPICLNITHRSICQFILITQGLLAAIYAVVVTIALFMIIICIGYINYWRSNRRDKDGKRN
jgi:small-conductance mechanosensitive channel